MKAWQFIRSIRFVLLLLLGFFLVDAAAAYWNPMVTSMRFRKNDFTKTISHHGGAESGRVFFGNSAVTGAYMEDKSRYPLVEMGLSYGKITDLQAILEHPWYEVKDQLVLGIDVHTMLDKLDTDPTYPWHKKAYQPYLYAYRDYFKEALTDGARQLYKGTVELNRSELFAYEPKWNDKELYFGRNKPEEDARDWERYEKLFNGSRLENGDFADNLAALDRVMTDVQAKGLDFKVVWMPLNPARPHPAYFDALKAEVNRRLQARQVPVLDLTDRYPEELFHDLVHLNREKGAPQFTKEVDEWLLSFAKPSKS
ncbi:SGNH/GDSL hydrolase family protein [Paenibacillus aurantius]|uniref:SGNH/GDSL hydrolase family protein n=1 Tax=Paenibacillus aurantius TaxID=2918900 RepID=A0AA96RDQ0_9BACL|nr:SGNH/GDSL hydrolase family protein [Paenibacillus aurantius]WNQ11635.1 SGNH/GDSL hydrolase family protein [Paenibacillus aurantius]